MSDNADTSKVPARRLSPGRIGEILRPGDKSEQARQERHVRRSLFSTLRRAARFIPFSEDVVASYYCAVDTQTPARTRGILLAALAYFVLPVDLVPDFVLGLGFTDDAAVLLAAFSAVRSDIRPRHYEKARAALAEHEEAAPQAGKASHAEP